MLVIALDGVLFDSLDARAMVLSDALSAEGLVPGDDAVRTAIVGRTFSEAVRFLASDDSDGALHTPLDVTSLDIATIRADQAYAALAARGFSLNTHARDMLQRAASMTRVVLRADSRRRETDALLAFAGLDTAVSMTRCSDDPAPRRRHPGSTGASDAFTNSVHSSYDAIVQRMWQNNNLLGTRGPVGIVLEAGSLATSVASALGFEAAPSVSALNFPAR